MTNLEIGVAGIAVALALIALRVPIGIALGLVSIGGIASMMNMRVAWGVISATPFDFVGDWALTAAPMFLLMGYIATATGLTNGLFNAMRIALFRLPGGLAVASVAACALFASASGSSVATSAAMSRIAVPEMLKHKYDKGLATGVIAASGTLGSLIPPSVLLVLYGVYAQVSVGQLFMAGVIPGILSALLYVVMIVTRVKLNPGLAGVVEAQFSREEKIAAVKDIWPLPLLIASVIGGIFLGIFSPTEAGALGAFTAFIIALIRGKVTRESIKEAFTSTAISTTSIFIILIGSVLFTRFLAFSGVPMAFSELILGVSVSPIWVIFAVIVIYLVLGMFIDSISLLLLTLPLLLPLVTGAGLDLIWFGIIAIKLLEIGLVTPPVGLNVYVIKASLGTSVTLQDVFRGVAWFLVMDVAALVLLIAFPALVLWLPRLMYI
jgi:C4-dicarboxylate transporter DctM subunit